MEPLNPKPAVSVGHQSHVPQAALSCAGLSPGRRCGPAGAEAGTRGPGGDHSERVTSRWQSVLPAATGVDKATFEDVKSEDHGAQHTR